MHPWAGDQGQAGFQRAADSETWKAALRIPLGFARGWEPVMVGGQRRMNRAPCWDCGWGGAGRMGWWGQSSDTGTAGDTVIEEWLSSEGGTCLGKGLPPLP